jgi:predicted nucleic acid-binding protein
VNVLVDTSVWSVALRRRASSELGAVEQGAVRELSTLIDEARACMAGCIRQEVLSGVGSATQFDRLRDKLGAFNDLAAEPPTYECAARFFNQCRARGVQGSHIDFLICALADQYQVPIFTLDADFARYAEVCGVELHQPRV